MARSPLSIGLIAGISLSLLSACGAGNGDGLDESGRPLSESAGSGDDDNSETTPESSNLFTRIQSEILTPQCATSGCHNGTTSPLGLNLVEGKSYNKLVGVDSSQTTGLKLVDASNADGSYLVHKVEGTQTGGLQMPLNKPPLTADQMQLIRQWISEGALNEQTDEDGGDAEPSEAPTYSTLQTTVFDVHCIACHSTEYPAGALNLEAEVSYSHLVNIAMRIDPDNSVLVVPNDADNSFLVHKLSGERLGKPSDSGYRGAQMPLGGPYLDDATINSIRAWINAGALDN